MPCSRCLGPAHLAYLHTRHKISFNLSGKEVWACHRTVIQLTILFFNSSSFFHCIISTGIGKELTVHELVSLYSDAWNILSSQHGLLHLTEEDGRDEGKSKAIECFKVSNLFGAFHTVSNNTEWPLVPPGLPWISTTCLILVFINTYLARKNSGRDVLGVIAQI